MTAPATALSRLGQERLRFLTCGSVDDGKSTLIGRLLYDSGQILDDQLSTLERDSRRGGAVAGGGLDFSLLVDGLEAEREQNITIDVAYRYFATAARSFMVADTPGHEQYTRNMATGASTAELAVILIDARKGVLPQTCRHARICSLMGIKHVVLAVNKIDLVGFSVTVFEKIRADFERFAAGLGFTSIEAIPLSALLGDNVFGRSVHTYWYRGPTLIEHLETVEVASERAEKPLRMAVQLVRRPSSDLRLLSGRIASGTLAKGQPIAVAVSGATSTVKSILGPDGEIERADAGLAVTVALADDIDVARGDLLVPPKSRPTVAERVTAHVLWMAPEPMVPGRRYLMRIGTRWVFASITQLAYRLDINGGEHETASHLGLNEIGVASLATDLPIAFDAYSADRSTGAFILVDRDSNAIVAAGMIEPQAAKATSTERKPTRIDRAARSNLKGHRSLCVWITGLAGPAKAGLADTLEQELHRLGMHTARLDDAKLTLDPGRQSKDFRRIGEAAALMTDAGLLVLANVEAVSLGEREALRALLPAGDFVEVFAGRWQTGTSPTSANPRADLRIVTSAGATFQPHRPPEASLPVADLEADPRAIADVLALIAKAVQPGPDERQ